MYEGVNEIARQYYRTTAARGHSNKRGHYEKCADGLVRRLGRWLPAKDVPSLDLACGCGELLYALERAGISDLTGVDVCRESIVYAGEVTRAKLICDDALSWLRRCSPGTFGYVTALNFAEHVSKKELIEVFSEVRRVLIPGGVFVLMVPNAISPFGTLTRHWDFTHEWAFTPNNFRQLAALTGFASKIDVRECGPVAYGIKSGLRFAAWQLIRLWIASWLLIEVADAKERVYTMDMLVRLRAE